MLRGMDALDSLQPRILTGEKGVYRHGIWTLREGREAWARLYAVVEGEGFVRHHGKTFRLAPGRLYLIPPDSGVDLGTPAEVAIWWVHATLLIGGGLDFFRLVEPRYELPDDGRGTLKEAMGKMIELWGAATIPSRLAAHGILLDLLARFMPEGAILGRSLTPDWRRFLPALHRMGDTGEEPPTVAELARLTGLSRGQFSSRFHELVGMAPVRYLVKSKVERVKALLRSPEAPGLEALAARCGFHDAFHLSKTFKRVTGVSPKNYRQNLGKHPMA